MRAHLILIRATHTRMAVISIIYEFLVCVLVLCTQVNIMFLMLL
jgi:hypothetical protein